MNGTIYEVIIIGAGHTGLSASYYLKHLGLEHIVFERGRVGQTWRDQRWDNFNMVTMNRQNVLPGATVKYKQPEQFATAGEFADSLRDYVNHFELPISEHSNVLSIEKLTGSPVFSVKVSHDNEGSRTYDCWQVIVASGMQTGKLVPSFSRLIAPHIKQIHSSEYKNAGQFPDGGVLVVGSGQSGCEIAGDLLDAGRRVVVACSSRPYLPRNYRGKDILEWLILCKFMDEPIVDDTNCLNGKGPVIQTSNAEQGELSLRNLANRGAAIFGYLTNASGNSVSLEGNAVAVMRSADEYALSVMEMIDNYITTNQLQVDPRKEKFLEHSSTAEVSDALNLKLEDYNIRSIVWATGHTNKLSFIQLPIFDETGAVIQQSGVTPVDGLYVVGVPFKRAGRNAFVFGVKDETGFVTNRIYSILR